MIELHPNNVFCSFSFLLAKKRNKIKMKCKDLLKKVMMDTILKNALKASYKPCYIERLGPGKSQLLNSR